MSHLEELRAHPFLDGLVDAHLARIDACCTEAVQFPPDTTIFRAGQQARACYLLQEGSVVLEVSNGRGATRTLDRLGGGDVLGWSWIFAPFQWRFDARAETEVHALALRAEPLRQVKNTDHALGIELMDRFVEVIVGRLHAARLRLLED